MSCEKLSPPAGGGLNGTGDGELQSAQVRREAARTELGKQKQKVANFWNVVGTEQKCKSHRAISGSESEKDVLRGKQ